MRESSLAVMDTLSKALGVDIYVYESYVNEKGQRVYLSDRGEKKAPNGYYDPSDGSIHIDLNAGQDGKGTMLFTVAHELTHFIKDWSSVKYRALADALVKQYQKQGVTVSELVDNQIAKAKQNGREMSRQEAFDEVVADSMESMLTDENAAAFLEKLAQRDKGLKEKIVSWLKDLAAKLKKALSAYKDVEPDSPEGKMVAQMEDFRKEIMGIYTSALVDAGENFRENGGNENTTREGWENLSAQVRSDRIVDQIRKSIDDIMSIDSVYAINDGNATGYTGDRKNDEVAGHKVFLSQGGYADRPGFGRVILGKRGIVDTVFHGNGPAKQASIPAIKGVIEKGIEINFEENHEGRGYDTVTFAAPVDFFEEKSALGVVVKVFNNGRGDKSFYIHEICDSEGNYMKMDSVFPDKKISNTGLVEPTSTADVADRGNTSNDSIRNPEPVVKKKIQMSDRDSDGRQISDGQREYFKDSVVRDDDGNLIPVYHSTHEEFYTFKRGKLGGETLVNANDASLAATSLVGHWFSDHDNSNRIGGHSLKCYLNITRPYRTDLDSLAAEIGSYSDDLDKMQEHFEMGQYNLVRKAASDFVRWLRSNGYDGLVVDDREFGGNSYVVLNSRQAKLTTNENPTGRNDTRFSDRDPTVEATRAALEKENGKLREDVSRLRELLRLQGKVTGGTVMKPSSVDAAARWLNKYAGAKADVKELSRMLTEFYRFIATDKDYSWEDVHERAMVIAKYLQDNVQLKPKMSEYARDVLRDIRGIKITLDESQRAEVEYRYGSYEAFRKAAFGNVTFVKEGGIPLDSQWHDWASLYPGTFDSEITAKDQPQALMDAIDALRNSDTTVMEYAYNRESIAQDLAVAVYDSYWRVDALRTVADRDQRKINDLTARQEALKGTISEKNEQIKKLRAEHRNEMESLKEERNKTVPKIASQGADKRD